MIASRPLAAPAAALLLLLTPLPATAAPARNCSAMVADPAEYFNDPEAVSDAASDLRAAGGDVYVTIVRNVPEGDVDGYQQTLESKCKSWRRSAGTSGEGSRKNNLVSLIVSVEDRAVGLYYGSEFTDALDGAWLDIQTDSMSPEFREGRYDEGVAAGLQAVAEQLEEPTYDEEPYVEGPYNPIEVGSGPPPSSRTVPTGALAIGAGGLAALGLLIAGGLWWWRARRRRAELDQLRLAAVAARDEAQDAFLKLEREENALEIAAAAYGAAAGEGHPPLLSDIATVHQRTAEANKRYLDTADAVAMAKVKLDKPGRARTAEAAYTEPHAQFDARRAELAEVAAAVAELTTRVEAACQLILALPADLKSAGQEIGELAQAQVDIAAGGMRTDRADAVLATARAELTAVESVRRSERYAQASLELLALRTRVGEASEWLGGLVARRAQAHDDLAALTSEAAGMESDLAAAQRLIQTLSAVVAAASLQPSRAAETATTAALRALSDDLAGARAGLAGVVDVDAVSAQVTSATGHRDDARASLDSTVTALAEVEQARTETPALLAAAKQALDSARAVLTKPTERPDLVLRMDAAALQARLVDATGAYDLALAAWSDRPPDVLAAADGARTAQAEADAVETAVRGAVEQATQVREALNTALAGAGAAVAAAAAILDRGGWDVGGEAKANFASSESLLHSAHAGAALEPERSLQSAREAESLAIAAAQQAEADIAYAAEQRARAQRQAMLAASSHRSHSSFSGGSGISSGGGGFSGGGGGGGGGGSSRW